MLRIPEQPKMPYLHVRSKGILKMTRSVLPPCRSVAVMPLEAVANTILPCDLIFERMRLIRYVSPVIPRCIEKHDIHGVLLLGTFSCSSISRNALHTWCWPLVRLLCSCSVRIANSSWSYSISLRYSLARRCSAIFSV